MPTIPTYWDYLNLDQLLNLQGGLEDREDEMLADELHFIIVHQTYELWFKMILRSMRLARDEMQKQHMDEAMVPVVAHHLRRVNSILKLATHQFEVMETLAPQDFLDFREKLTPSSGFQSFQMREMEILMGLEAKDRVLYGGVDPIKHVQELAQDTPAGRLAAARVNAVREEKTLVACVHDWLYRTPINGSVPGDEGDEAVVQAFVDDYLKSSNANMDANLKALMDTLGDLGNMGKKFESARKAAHTFLNAEIDGLSDEERRRAQRIRAAALFIESYRHLPLLSWPRLLLDVIVEFEEQLVIWRHRHARMVERIIGRRVGTGGSGGVEYLDKTTHYRVFRDLWAIRSMLLPRSRVPALKNPEFYGFS